MQGRFVSNHLSSYKHKIKPLEVCSLHKRIDLPDLVIRFRKAKRDRVQYEIYPFCLSNMR